MRLVLAALVRLLIAEAQHIWRQMHRGLLEMVVSLVVCWGTQRFASAPVMQHQRNPPTPLWR